MSFLRKFRKGKSQSSEDPKSAQSKRGFDYTIQNENRSLDSRSKTSTPFPVGTDVFIKSIPLLSLDQVTAIGDEVRNGNIVILDTEPMSLSKKQRIDLRRAVDQLRGICREFGGDLAQLGESYYIVITPAFIRIAEREETSESEENTAALPPSQ